MSWSCSQQPSPVLYGRGHSKSAEKLTGSCWAFLDTLQLHCYAMLCLQSVCGVSSQTPIASKIKKISLPKRKLLSAIHHRKAPGNRCFFAAHFRSSAGAMYTMRDSPGESRGCFSFPLHRIADLCNKLVGIPGFVRADVVDVEEQAVKCPAVVLYPGSHGFIDLTDLAIASPEGG